MGKKKLVSIFVALISITTILSLGYVTYAKNENNIVISKAQKPKVNVEKIDNSKYLNNQSKSISQPVTQNIEIEKPKDTNYDLSKIKLSTDITNYFKKSDSKNFNKNINNFKNFIVKFNVPDEFKDKVDKLIKKGEKVPNILALYNFLYDNYGTINELEELADKLELGTSLANIIKNYNSSHPEFVPSKFDNTYLENLMKTMSIDDILIADRLSQKGLAKFEDLIGKRQKGMSWKEINTELGVINTSNQLPRLSLTHAQINKCMSDNKLSEKDAVNMLILAKNAGKDYSVISSEFKNGKKENDIMAETYDERYK